MITPTEARRILACSFSIGGASLASGILTTFVTKPERSNIQT
jgi:hypothetical protein